MGLLPGNADRVLAALQRSLAVIEFTPTGDIIDANANFCSVLGYSRPELIGKHHRMFVDAAFAGSSEYTDFWTSLGGGAFVSDVFKRFGKGGKEIWIRATYNPVLGARGQVLKVVKFASDVTEIKRKSIEDAGKLDALSRSQAIIEFTADGQILTANENFLTVLGYGLDEIVGRHHHMFVHPSEAQTPDYAAFWRDLATGVHKVADFKRVGKNGREVWIQASYNPIRDENGAVVKVVKFATDLTDRMTALERLGSALGALAEGDLTQRLDRPFGPSLETIRHSFNASLAPLADAMASVVRSGKTIHASTEQIRVAADDLARRTEQQAAALEQTTAALAEINGTVKAASKNAETAGCLVSATKGDAGASAKVVAEAVDAMAEIERSSVEIGKIIGVIDEIAFQTNLLALNAGVEAARAGEAGKGFAVVASEVRALAQRSADAAKQIKDLITTSTGQVSAGVGLVGRTGSFLGSMSEKVIQIDDNVRSIVEGGRSQSNALNEISIAMDTLDQGTQQNAAMVEQSTAASNELALEASRLHQLLARFRLPPVAGNAEDPRLGGPLEAEERPFARAAARGGRF